MPPCDQNGKCKDKEPFKNLVQYLQSDNSYKAGFKTYVFHYVSDAFTTRQIAEALRERIDENCDLSDRRLVIVAHSMGGLVARHYMSLRTQSGSNSQFLNQKAGERVTTLITLATPHHGTYGANGLARMSRFWGSDADIATVLFPALDYLYWQKISGCKDCVSDLQHSNRGSLLWDNFDSRWSSAYLYTLSGFESLETNLDLPDPNSYNSKMVTYWGEVNTSDDAWQKIANSLKPPLVKNIKALYNKYKGGGDAKTDIQAALGAYLTQDINDGRFNDLNTKPQNDGLVPVESARFDSTPWHTTVHCGGYNHRELKDGSWSKQCENRKFLFDSIRDDIINGTNTSSALLLASQETTFGSQNFGSAAISKPESIQSLVAIENTSLVELGNAGNTALQVTSLSLTGTDSNQFSILSAPTTPFTIGAKSSAFVVIAFNPTSTGSKTATLQAFNSSSNAVVTVPLEGSGFPSSCDITFSPENRYLPVQGGSGSFTIPNISCPSTVSTNYNWIHPTASGSTVNFTVDGNATGATRGGTIDVSIFDRVYSFDIQQASSSSGCTLNLSGNTQNFNSSGGSGSFNVITPDTCGWGFQSGSPWITVNNQGLRGGSGSVSFTVAPSTAPSLRVGTIIVEGQDTTQVFTVTQDAGSGSCTYSLQSGNEQIIPAGGGQFNFTLSAGQGCPWQISSPDRWITFNSHNNGIGSEVISYNASANPSSSTRLGSISIQAGSSTLLLTVNQNGQPLVYPSISLPTTNISMADALVNTTIYQGVVIGNNGPGYLFLGSIYRSSGNTDFDVLPYAQNQIIAPGGTTSVTIKLTPSSTGNRTATFSVTSNDPNNPSINFSISGNGVTQTSGGIDFVWNNKSTIPESSFTYASSAVINNFIYVFGGGNSGTGKNYKYDPTTNTWTPIAAAPNSTYYGGAAAINGKIYLAAPDTFGSGTGKIQVYDPNTNGWTAKSSIPNATNGMAVATANGKLYVIGGSDGGTGATTFVREYDPASDSWTMKTAMPTTLAYAAIAVVNNLVYVLGGQGAGGSRSGATEVFDPVANSWTGRQSDPTQRASSSAVAVNNQIYVIGGSQGGPDTIDVVEQHDPSINASFGTWFQRNHVLTPRANFVSGVVNGKVYVIGGRANNGGDISTVEEGVFAASPKINLPVTTFNCGDIPLGNFCDKRIEIQNEGNAQLVISNWGRSSGSDEFNAFFGSNIVDAGQSNSFIVRLTPTSTGSKAATFFVNSNDPSTPSLTFTLSANVVTPTSVNGTWQIVKSVQLANPSKVPTAVAVSNGLAYISRFSASVTVVNIATGAIVAEIPFSSFPNADVQSIAISGNRAYVVLGNLVPGRVAVINTDNNTVLTYVSVSGAHPAGIAVTDSYVYLPNAGPDTVSVIDRTTNTVTTTIPITAGAVWIAVDSNAGRAYITGTRACANSTGGCVTVIDTTANTVVSTIPIPTPYSLDGVSVSSARAYILTEAGVEAIDLSSNVPTATTAVSRYTDGGSIAATADNILIGSGFSATDGTVSIINPNTNFIYGKVAINSPVRIAVDPTTGLVCVVDYNDAVLKILRFISPGFSVSTNAQTLAATPGGSTAFTSTVTSIDGFSGAVNLSCEGLPTGATCQFSQNPVTVPANGSVSTSLTVTVPAGTVAGPYSLRVVGSGTVSQGSVQNSKGLASVLATTTVSNFQNLSLTVPSCDFALSSQSISLDAGANTRTVDVSGTTGCAWNASSNAAWINVTSNANGSGNGLVFYSVAANTGTASRTGTVTIAGQTLTITQAANSSTQRVDSVIALAGRTSGGQQIRLTGTFPGLSTVTMGGSSALWSYTNGPGDTSSITITTPAHAVGAVQIDLTPTSGSGFSRANAFAYLPTVFTDNTIMVGQTTAKAQHIIELRQAIDAMRAVAGLSSAPWTDPSLAAGNTIRAVHIMNLRTFLDDAATRLGYSTSPYTDPSLTSGFVIKRIHVEELRQRIRTIAG